MSITESELLDALAQAVAGNAPEDARTVPEMSAESGVSVTRVRKALHLLNAQGRLNVHRVVRRALDGRAGTVAAYTIAPKSPR